MAARTFEDSEAKRGQVPLLLGFVGPSGGGKTMSALRVAHGIQAVTGGEIYFIDTEANRALHYAERKVAPIFRFRHLPFVAPFSPLDYLQAIEHCISKGAKTIIIDSTSHEHEGPGGVLEMHAEEMLRMARGDEERAPAYDQLAWQKPKAMRRRLINSLLQLPISLLFCFRAKEKLRIVKGKAPEPRGWQPIAGSEFIYEMSINFLLPPGADGTPEWKPEERDARQMVKIPIHFRDIFLADRPEQLTERQGMAMAEWAAGGARETDLSIALRADLDAADTLERLAAVSARAGEGKRTKSITAAEFAALGRAFVEKKKVLEAASAADSEPPADAEPEAEVA